MKKKIKLYYWKKYVKSNKLVPGAWCLEGVVYGHSKHKDGTIVLTSPVILWGEDDKGLWVETYSGSVYRLANKYEENS